MARVAGNPQEHLATDRVEQEQRGQPALLVGVCPHAVCAGPNVRQVGETVSVFTAASLDDLIRRHTEWRMGTGPSPCASCCTCRGRLLSGSVCNSKRLPPGHCCCTCGPGARKELRRPEIPLAAGVAVLLSWRATGCLISKKVASTRSACSLRVDFLMRSMGRSAAASEQNLSKVALPMLTTDSFTVLASSGSCVATNSRIFHFAPPAGAIPA